MVIGSKRETTEQVDRLTETNQRGKTEGALAYILSDVVARLLDPWPWFPFPHSRATKQLCPTVGVVLDHAPLNELDSGECDKYDIPKIKWPSHPSSRWSSSNGLASLE